MSARHTLPAALLAGLAALVVGLTPPARLAAAPDDPPPGPRYVPADAAGFVHVDAAALYGGPILKAVRAADPTTFAELTGKAKSLFGVAPDDLRSATVFWPKVKAERDAAALGVVLSFKTGYDAVRLEKGVKEAADGVPVKLYAVDDRTAVVLAGGLGDEYARPRPAGEAGPLAAALKEAGSGKYLVAAGANPDNLPDEVRGDDVPPDLKPFQTLLQAKAVVGLVSLGKELAAEVRVTADSPPKAVEAEKALGLLVKLMQDGLAGARKELGPGLEKDAALKDVATILAAVDAGLKGATFETTGAETRARVSLPADLPFGGAYLAALGKVRGAADRSVSANNLKQIALAMHNYHDAYGAFPPAAVVDKDGKPLLSWRVLILPFIEQDNLFKEFKPDEPWDSEHNKKLIGKMPRTYQVPNRGDPKAGNTHYRVFTGKGAAFDLLQGAKITDFTDGTSNTVLAVTAAEAVPWTKPDELAFDPEKDMSKLLGFLHGDACMVAFADGSVRALKKTIRPPLLNLVLQRDDGMVIPADLDD